MTKLVQIPSNAEEQFIRLIESGDFKKRKQLEEFLKQAKAHTRTMLQDFDSKRHEFKDINMVAKFVPKKIWKVDHAGIIEELLCYVKPNIALSLIRIKPKKLKESGGDLYEELSEYLLPPSYYVSPYLNSVGKQKVSTTDYLFGGQSEKELILEIKETSHKFKKMDKEYTRFKEQVARCPDLLKSKKVKTKYGSLCLIKNKDKWDLPAAYKHFGEDLFINFGEVDMGLLEEFSLNKVVPSNIVSKYRKMTDIRLDFVVMDLSDEERALKFLKGIA